MPRKPDALLASNVQSDVSRATLSGSVIVDKREPIDEFLHT